MRKVDWANLECYPLSLVLDKLEEHIDHVRFGVVCKTWLSIAKLNHKNHQFRINVPPMLMILPNKLSHRHAKSKRKKRSLYSILSEKEYPIQLSHPAIFKSKRCLGCSHGWHALVDDNHAITLANPFKCSIPPISLPHLEHLNQVTLSADPITSPSDYVVAAIYNFGFLAFKRASQSSWIRVHASEFSFTNVVFYKGLVFADTEGDIIVSFKFNDPPCNDSNDPNFIYFEKIASTPYFLPEECYYRNAYFVKSLTGDIWMVKRCLVDPQKHSYKLFVFKLELDAQSGKVEQINKLESLENNILFVGIGDSISVSAPCFSKFEKDSIYFICHGDGDDLELQIYNAKDGSLRSQSLLVSFKGMQHLWVLPQFQWD